jgi:LruC domain-containing protein
MKNLIFLLFLVAIAACRPFDLPEQQIVNSEDKTLEQLTIPDAFSFNSYKDISLAISVKDNTGKLMPDVPVNVYVKKQGSTDSLFLLSAQTSPDGVFETTVSLDADVETVVATTNYIGVPSYQSTPVSDNVVLTFGVENNINLPRNFVEGRSEPTALTTRGALNYTYMGAYDGSGVPKYLTAKGDIVSPDIMKALNASLPESVHLGKSHPSFISNATKQNLVLKANADVSITFVHEGTSLYNALGYYTYPTNAPPATVADIKNLKIIFPNISYKGSGGGLKTGDKVALGNFNAGTTVAWFAMPNGWDYSNQKVSDSRGTIRYSDKNFNTFTDEASRQHVVMLKDTERGLLFIGFEDLNRPSGDNDFNDAVFYSTVSPFSAVETTGIPDIATVPIDTDGDGVPDSEDAEPNNPDVAYYNYGPGLNQFNTLAFEDLWPSKGDYDMNDVVVDYNILEKFNSKNKVSQIKFKLTLRAFGGSFRNGFGFELPVPTNKIASVEGCKIKDSYIRLNPNGTEADQNKTVIIAFDNDYSLFNTPSGSFINTEKDKTGQSTYTFEITVKFSNFVTRAELGTAPYNPFIIINKERGKEVHLPGYRPTQLANTALFKTGDDNTKGNKTYQSKTNLPWAIHVAKSFQYPIEKAPINTAYLKFNKWAESGGVLFPDWYLNKTSYTNPAKIY